MTVTNNPLGLDGLAFAEFTSPDPVLMARNWLGTQSRLCQLDYDNCWFNFQKAQLPK